MQKNNYLIKKHVSIQENVPTTSQSVLNLKPIYNEIIDLIASCPVTGKNSVLSPNVFYRSMASWMALAMTQCSIEKIESNPEYDFGIDVDDLCRLPDDLNGLHTITDILQFIDSLDKRAMRCDGKPFRNWSVRDIVGTIRSENFDMYYNEFIGLIIDTPIPAKIML